MIELKNIDLSKITYIDQKYKVVEERKEFMDAVADYRYCGGSKEDKEHMIEEFYDMVQAGLGLMQKVGVNAEEVEKYYPKHLEKIKNRPR